MLYNKLYGKTYNRFQLISNELQVWGFIFYEDGSIDVSINGQYMAQEPAGTITFSDNKIYENGSHVLNISADKKGFSTPYLSRQVCFALFLTSSDCILCSTPYLSIFVCFIFYFLQHWFLCCLKFYTTITFVYRKN